MPYLQLDLSDSYPIAIKKELAKQMGEVYSDIMKANINRVTVSIRELGEGNIWRCTATEPIPGAILMCDIRKGRTKEIRETLSVALIKLCNDLLNLTPDQLNIEFTQHTGDEMFHQRMGGFSDDWKDDEA